MDAEQALRKAVDLDSTFAPAWIALTAFLVKRFRLGEAEDACREAIALEPDSAVPRALMAEIHVQRWKYDEADVEYQTALARDPDNRDLLSHRLFLLNYQPTHHPEKVAHIAREYERAVRRNVTPFGTWNVSREANRRLRVGLLCGDLYRHPVGHFLRGPLAFLDRLAFELIAYSNNSREDEVTGEIKRHVSGWVSALGLDDAGLAQRIHADGIDLLIDLSGHTEHGRLGVFAWRPAPVQVTWLGFFATTGLRDIDWKLGDRWVTPVEEEHHFTERIWRLPDSCFCYSAPAEAPEVVQPPSVATGSTTFGCFNNLAKLNDGVVRLWAAILHAAPGSTLLLKARQLESDEIAQHVRGRFEQVGVAADRLTLEGSSRYEDYLRAHGRVDIALDPFPYAGGATTADALWMGVPVVTMKGDRYIGHQGESLLHAATLSDWIAKNERRLCTNGCHTCGGAERTPEVESASTCTSRCIPTLRCAALREQPRSRMARYVGAVVSAVTDLFEKEAPDAGVGHARRHRLVRCDEAG